MGTFVADPAKKERILANVLANQEKYPNFNLISGKGDLLDTAKAAYVLAGGKIPQNIAILGPKALK